MLRPIILALLLSTIGRAQGSCPEFVEFTPDVILDDGISSTRLELKARENTQSVILELPAGTPVKIGGTSGCDGAMALPLHDDGTGGDLQAGDNLFTLDDITWDPSASPECNAIFHPFFEFGPAFKGHRQITLGRFVVTNDDQAVLYVDQLAYLLHVLSSQEFVQADRVHKVAFDVQVASHVINLIDKERIIASGSPDFEALGHSFYSHFPDEYDFLNLIGSEYALQLHDAGPDGRCRVGPLFFGAIHPIGVCT